MNRALRSAAFACAIGLVALPAAPALARDAAAPRPAAAPAQALPAVPSLTSENVKLLAGLPLAGAISMEFARTGEFAYVSTLEAIFVIDLKDPKNPALRGFVTNVLFENEAMTYGERVIDGKLTKFVIAAIDLVQASPSDPTHLNLDSGPEVVIVDVTDPDNPFIRSRTPQQPMPGAATTSTHTVQCVDQADCSYAYTAGTGSAFSILDFTDLDKPRQLKTVPSPAAGPGKDGFARGAGHYWDFDGELGWHTGSGGAAAFDVSDPRNPRIVTATNAKGRGAPINDFILHNSMRPNAKAFTPGAAPSVKNGNVLLVTEEDYFDNGDEPVCTEAGSFQTWYVPDLDAEAYRTRNLDGKTQDVGTIAPLDQVNAPSEFAGGASTPVSAFCSAHWFDVHQDGFVALGHYGAGLRVLDVRDARNIKQHGYATGGATQVWDAYWVPKRTAAGVVIPGQKTNLVYTADAVRGVEVFEVALTGANVAPPANNPPPNQPPPPNAPPAPNAPPVSAPGGSQGTGGALAATGLGTSLPLLATAGVGLAIVVRRRRQRA